MCFFKIFRMKNKVHNYVNVVSNTTVLYTAYCKDSRGLLVSSWISEYKRAVGVDMIFYSQHNIVWVFNFCSNLYIAFRGYSHNWFVSMVPANSQSCALISLFIAKNIRHTAELLHDYKWKIDKKAKLKFFNNEI